MLTQPLSLDGGLAAEHQSPNIVQRLISLFKNVRPGTDLTHFQVSPPPPPSITFIAAAPRRTRHD